MTAIHRLIEQLRGRGWTLALAESCTGGLVSATMTSIPGVSDIYLGAVVSYANSVKESLLHVTKDCLQVNGAVSAETALQMVRGVRDALKSDCALAITGVAGPSGGSEFKPVGTVFVAALGPEFETVKRENFAGDRQTIQQQAVLSSVNLLLNQIINASR